MAGEWIPIDCNLGTKPEVLELVDETGEPVEVVVYRLIQLWSWASMNTADGTIRATSRRLAAVAGGDESFWHAVERVGWVSFVDGTVVIEGWEKRFSRAAKARMEDARRKADARAVRRLSEICPGKTGLQEKRGEESTGENRKESTHTHGGDDFRQPGWAATEWQRFVAAWNVTERAEPWPHLTPPDGWVDLAAAPGWLERAREALARLPSRQFFDRPLPVTRFFDFVDRIRAGEFADPKGSARTKVRQPLGGNL